MRPFKLLNKNLQLILTDRAQILICSGFHASRKICQVVLEYIQNITDKNIGESLWQC